MQTKHKHPTATQKKTKAIEIDGHSLTLDEFVAVLDGRPVSLAAGAKSRIAASRARIDQAIAEDAPVYGVNTGFGELARVSISSADLEQLQVNLIRSHQVGVGPPLGAREVRGMLLLRANSLASGCSGVRVALVERLIDLLNHDVLPVVPSQGSVGASGDLAPLAHLAAVLIGEGEAHFAGKRMAGAKALARAGLEPFRLAPKEGLALINGTQLMTSIGLIALSEARAVFSAAEVAAAISVEALLASHVPFDPRLARARPHPGHARVSRRLARLLRGSRMHRSHRDCGRVQDAYSLRCIPQVMGATLDALDHIGRVLAIEMNAVTDNPLVFVSQREDIGSERPHASRTKDILSGGNFHGQPVALCLDYLTPAIAEIGSISERRTYRLLDTRLSGLDPFLTPNPGTQSGLMVVQYTAAALVSENKVLAHPACVDSIPTCAGTEDHVSMGPISARKASAAVRNVARIIACELLCAARGLEFHRPLESSPAVEEAVALVREHVPGTSDDRPRTAELEALATEILSDRFRTLGER